MTVGRRASDFLWLLFHHTSLLCSLCSWSRPKTLGKKRRQVYRPPWLELIATFPRLVLVSQLCLTLCDPVDCSSPGSSVHGIYQARILEGVAVPFSRVSSPPRVWTQISCITGRFLTIWATKEADTYLYVYMLKKNDWTSTKQASVSTT